MNNNSSEPGNAMEYISITDSNGRAIYHFEVDTNNFFNKEFDISAFTSGTPIVKITTAKSTETIEILKE